MLGELLILFIVLGILVVLAQVLLYHNRYGAHAGIWIFNVLIALVVSFLAYSSLPDNETGKKIATLLFGGIGAVGFVLGIMGRRSNVLAKILLSVSIIGMTLFLFIGL